MTSMTDLSTECDRTISRNVNVSGFGARTKAQIAQQHTPGTATDRALGEDSIRLSHVAHESVCTERSFYKKRDARCPFYSFHRYGYA